MSDDSETREIGARIAAAMVQLAHALALEGHAVHLTSEIQDGNTSPAHVVTTLVVTPPAWPSLRPTP